jgi:hypothetical protein
MPFSQNYWMTPILFDTNYIVDYDHGPAKHTPRSLLLNNAKLQSLVLTILKYIYRASKIRLVLVDDLSSNYG